MRRKGLEATQSFPWGTACSYRCHKSSQLWQGSECDKRHAAPFNECSVFSIHPLWRRLLSFVSDGYFCVSFEVTVARLVKADKCATLNSQMKIAEFNFFHLLEADSLWYHKRKKFFPHKVVQQFLNSRDWLSVMGWFEYMLDHSSTSEFRFWVLVLLTKQDSTVTSDHLIPVVEFVTA